MSDFPQYKQQAVEDLIPYARNARTHSDEQVDKIAASIREFGFLNPVITDGDNGIVAGHGRIMAAKKLGMDEVPTVEAAHLTDAQKRAYILADNRLALDAGWDDELLRVEFTELQDAGFDLNLTGFTDDEIAALEPDPDPEEGLTDEDSVPDVPEQPVTVEGDVWLLGRHRLMCGDSTDAASVARLMDGEKADMVFTDPPYGMSLDTDYSKMPSTKRDGNKKYSKVMGDNEDFTPELVNTVFSCFDYCMEIFLWGADYYAEHLPNKNDGSWVVWDKRCEEKFDRMIGSGFELCWSKSKHKRMIARVNNTLFSGESEARKKVHPTQKPTKLILWFFENWGNGLSCVVDLFGGSGSTLIACEKTSRQCRMMELDPKYCDVIITRWQDFTGYQAVHEETGRTFDEVANA